MPLTFLCLLRLCLLHFSAFPPKLHQPGRGGRDRKRVVGNDDPPWSDHVGSRRSLDFARPHVALRKPARRNRMRFFCSRVAACHAIAQRRLVRRHGLPKRPRFLPHRPQGDGYRRGPIRRVSGQITRLAFPAALHTVLLDCLQGSLSFCPHVDGHNDLLTV